MEPAGKIYVAGHRGLAGSAILRCLRRRGFSNTIGKSHAELDLTRQEAVERFFATERPEYVFLAAARVGGIMANNTYRAEFIYTNLQIYANIIHSAWLSGVRKLLFLSSSCVYPRLCPQPMKEDHFGTGPLEPTNEPFAAAKLAGMSLCRAYRAQHGADFIVAVPTNLYGPHDNFDPAQSHLLAALIRRFHDAKTNRRPHETLWGTGAPRREMLHADDLAEAAVFLMQNYSHPDPINVGWGEDSTIREIAATVQRVVGYEGEVRFDPQKPDGAPRKLLDTTRIRSLGWAPAVPLEEGLKRTYAWYLENH